MVRLILTGEQAELVAGADEVEICDQDGRPIGKLAPLVTAEELAEMRRALASDQPRYTTEQVLAHLNSLSSK